ncbi:MAG: DNA polymerase III [Betaproteobacteria bacterium RIFCSPLOWO2_02_FULL_62_17]|nr:MAG: DNA polymerase III [Betaproteobacteria bacterium RIFCSPLOWO2_02_FULL_62_17]
MPVHNADIARIFEEIADLLEIGDANPFRVRAYRRASRVIGELQFDAAAAIQRGEALPKLPGIGDDLSDKMHEIAKTGNSALLDRLRGQLPAAITELLAIPGLGPKRVKTLYHDLDVHTLEQLHRAARDGRIRSLPGFGEKTELNILQAVEARRTKVRRFKLATAAQYAGAFAEHLRSARGVGQVVLAGSMRRMRDTVGDIDILVTAADSSDVTERFVSYGEVRQVLSRGPTRASVTLRSGLQVDLRVVPAQSYGAALHYFTGSKAHNIAIRALAQERGLKVNEYGVFKGAQRVAGETEESVYTAVGLPFIPPELREDRGEIEAARAGNLPRLIELNDVKGDLHSHTKWTDGYDSVEAMALAAKARGLSYLAITDHSRRLAAAHGLDPQRLRRQLDEIAGTALPGITLLKGIEVDILEDGTLDLPDSVLRELDIVIAAVHSSFNLSRARQTSRILRALANPLVTMLAHPSGRLIESREPYDVDMPQIVRKAAARGRFLELNAHPERLDLSDTYCRMAKDEGVLVSVNSDAHSVAQFDNLQYGIGQARRGWLTRKDVLNTRTCAELRALTGLARQTAG